jgi:DNA invertase Pin-like site-specific DNA recombinase
MQRLLRDAQAGRFAAVLVDDLSRLSRDLGNTWRILFEELAAAGVRVIDVTTGMASDGAGARLTFGAMALVNDTFLQLVRAETHRGMEGRAIAGFSTGGRTYGYTTVPEENPQDPEHPRRQPVIDESEAAVVRRIFVLFVGGVSLKAIAAILNFEGVPAPHDGGRGNQIGRGWPHTTVRAILANERYTGKVVWNASKWIRVAGTKARGRVERPESEWRIARHDELRIVDDDLWRAAQARFSRRASAARRGPLPGSGQHPSLLSGLLRCGVCNGSMTGVSRRVKNGVTYMNYGCTSHFTRGASICPNGTMISDLKATTGIVGALQRELTAPTMAQRFIDAFQRRRAELERHAAKDGAAARDQIREVERRVRNLAEALARVGWSDVLADSLRVEEERLATVKNQALAESRRSSGAPVPHVRLVESYLANLLALLRVDKAMSPSLLKLT